MKMTMTIRLAFLVSQIASITTAIDPIKCKGPSEESIDWFIAYKLPKLKESGDPTIKEGLGIAYILPGAYDWQISTHSINDSRSLVGLTLQPLYDNQAPDNGKEESSIAYIAYNDQPPVGKTVENGGHTKGLILTNSKGGIWLQHSVPHFLHLDNPNYSYPPTGEHNGQIFHCMNLNLKEVDNIGNILSITKPYIYNYSIPEQLKGSLPILDNLVEPHTHENRRHNEILDADDDEANHLLIITRQDVSHSLIQVNSAGRTLNSFAKGPSYHEEIYADWIGPKYESTLNVQSWLNGHGAYPSNCTSSLKVFNIDEKKIAGNTFSTHDDHSKWAVGIEQHVVCIGDLNRMEHQEERGGTVNCFTDENIWKAFKGIIFTTQPCGNHSLSAGDEIKQPSLSFFGKMKHKIVTLYRKWFSG